MVPNQGQNCSSMFYLPSWGPTDNVKEGAEGNIKLDYR